MAKIQIKSEKLTPFGGIFSICKQNSTKNIGCGYKVNAFTLKFIILSRMILTALFSCSFSYEIVMFSNGETMFNDVEHNLSVGKDTIKINPKYEHLRSFIESIPDVFEEEGREIYKSRNTIKLMNTPEGLSINVKRYHIPHGLNQMIYSWGIRAPKGKRVYEYARILKDKGIGTPDIL